MQLLTLEKVISHRNFASHATVITAGVKQQPHQASQMPWRIQKLQTKIKVFCSEKSINIECLVSFIFSPASPWSFAIAIASLFRSLSALALKIDYKRFLFALSTK
jgi:hypothetical protein